MSYQKVPHEKYPGYGTGNPQLPASAPPQPPPSGYPHPPPQQGGYQGYFDQGYPPPPPQHVDHGDHHYHHDSSGCFSFIRGCLAALCCCRN